MCGNRRRAARHSGAMYGAGYHSGRVPAAARGVMAIVEGVQQMRLASQQQQQQFQPQQQDFKAVPMTPGVAELPAQTRGVVYPSTYDDEKKPFSEKESVDFEVLPTYEESTEVSSPMIRTTESTPVRSVEPMYQPRIPSAARLPSNNDRLEASPSFSLFTSALAAYRSGDSGCCARGRAKRAAREVMRELIEVETARFEASHGSLRCGQRKQIRRDLEPVRAMLDDAIREVRREQAY